MPTYVLPTAAAAVLSSYTIGSQPESLAVTVDATPDGMTPASAAPAYATKPHVFTIVPTGTASPYVVSLVQTANGSHTIFYNEPIDTNGAISAISATPLARMRHMPSLVGKATGPRRFALSTVNRPAYDAHRLIVNFNLARLGNANIPDVERAHGAARAATYSQSSQGVTRIVTLADGVDMESARAAFASDSRVASVDRVRLRYPLSTSSGPVYPNDPFFTDGQQWYLDVIDAEDAWGLRPSVARAFRSPSSIRVPIPIKPKCSRALRRP